MKFTELLNKLKIWANKSKKGHAAGGVADVVTEGEYEGLSQLCRCSCILCIPCVGNLVR